MKVSMSWINSFVDISDITPQQYNDAMTMSGSKVEEIQQQGDDIRKVVAAKILKIEQHPSADKLVVCTMDIGEAEPIQIVTGAENVREGQTVPAALHKSRLPGGTVITKGKLRGVLSMGMLCSHEELGMAFEDYAGAVEDGILIIQEDVKPGTDICQVLGLDENIVEFEITSNRPDCLSVLGLARETAVTFDRKLNYVSPTVTESGGNINKMLSIDVQNPTLCPRYMARVIKDVKVGPSPDWMKKRLSSCGVRPINNIVDITNYVMLEYGQPMHAFDRSLIKGDTIIVRNARPDEKMTTLDEIERDLDKNMLVISDTQGAVAVAGVMGGEHSGIADDTQEIVFESANFDGASVRITAKKLGLRTESSARFEKGLDPQQAAEALDRACELVTLLGAGKVVSGVIDVNNSSMENPRIPFAPDKINALLGCEIAPARMVHILKSLGFVFIDDDVIAPSFRIDIKCTADLAEEVARIYGYNELPSTLLSGQTVVGGHDLRQKQMLQIKEILSGLSMYEILTYSFTSTAVFDMMQIPNDSPLRDTVTIQNPLGEENSVMRTTMLCSVLEVLARNYNFRNSDVRLFEIGRIYHKQEGYDLPDERQTLAIGMYDVDFYDLKGAVEQLIQAMKIKEAHFEPVTDDPSFHPGRTAALYIGEQYAGILGETHPDVTKNYDIGKRVYMAQIDIETLMSGVDANIHYKPLPKFPAVTRDLAFVADENLAVGKIEKVITDCAGSLLEDLKLFDIYRGAQLGENKKSVAYALSMRSYEKTLTDEDVNPVVDKILSQLKEQYQITLR